MVRLLFSAFIFMVEERNLHMERNLEKKLKRNIPLDYISVFITNLNMQNLVLVYKCGQEKLNNLYYQMKVQRRCSAWRKIKNLTLRNLNSRSWICIMPEEPRIHNRNVNMA